MQINNITPTNPKLLSDAVIGDCFMIPSKNTGRLFILVDFPDSDNPGCYKVVEFGGEGVLCYRTAQGLWDPSDAIVPVSIESVNFHEK